MPDLMSSWPLSCLANIHKLTDISQVKPLRNYAHTITLYAPATFNAVNADRCEQEIQAANIHAGNTHAGDTHAGEVQAGEV